MGARKSGKGRKKNRETGGKVASSRMERRRFKNVDPAPYNPREIDDEAYRGLSTSMDRFGYVEPIVVNDRTGRVVSGHVRLRKLKEAGYDRADMVVVDVDEMTEKEMNVTLNNPRIRGRFTSGLHALLDEINGSLKDTGEIFSDLKFDELLATMEPLPDDVVFPKIDLDEIQKKADRKKKEEFEMTCPKCGKKIRIRPPR